MRKKYGRRAGMRLRGGKKVRKVTIRFTTNKAVVRRRKEERGRKRTVATRDSLLMRGGRSRRQKGTGPWAVEERPGRECEDRTVSTAMSRLEVGKGVTRVWGVRTKGH